MSVIMVCNHHYCSDNPPAIVCRKCGKPAPCDTRKHGQKTHWFVNHRCQICGLSQRKIADYVEVALI